MERPGPRHRSPNITRVEKPKLTSVFCSQESVPFLTAGSGDMFCAWLHEKSRRQAFRTCVLMKGLNMPSTMPSVCLQMQHTVSQLIAVLCLKVRLRVHDPARHERLPLTDAANAAAGYCWPLVSSPCRQLMSVGVNNLCGKCIFR